jgi:hypothetical protein
MHDATINTDAPAAATRTDAGLHMLVIVHQVPVGGEWPDPCR